MGDYPQHALTFTGALAAGGERRTQATLVLGNGAFRVPTASVDLGGEAVEHLPAIAGGRTRVAVSATIERNHRRVNTEGLSTDAMVLFRIVGGVAKEAMNREVLGRLGDSRQKVRRVVGRTVANRQGSDHVRAMMRYQRHFGITPVPLHPPGSGEKVTADVLTLEAGRIDGNLHLFLDQAALLGNTEKSLEQSLESPFFRSRSWAF